MFCDFEDTTILLALMEQMVQSLGQTIDSDSLVSIGLKVVTVPTSSCWMCNSTNNKQLMYTILHATEKHVYSMVLTEQLELFLKDHLFKNLH